MFASDGIFVMFPGNAYFWFINVSRPPLTGVYLVDLVAVSLVSWIAIMVGFVCWTKSCKLGSTVFSEDAFYDIT